MGEVKEIISVEKQRRGKQKNKTKMMRCFTSERQESIRVRLDEEENEGIQVPTFGSGGEYSLTKG